ncbi:MAG: hypothetical protein HYR55_09500, partial [Acidobacteria bacterium]|nr:hypothetical protein [Acidobacteriota bacterium]
SDRERAGLTLAPTLPAWSAFSWAGAQQFLGGEIVSCPAAFRTIRRYLGDHLTFRPDSYGTLLALWIMGTYVHQIFDTFPYLWFRDGGNRSEVDRVLDILQRVVFNGASSSGRDGRATFRRADSASTMLIRSLPTDRRRNRLNTVRLGYRKAAVFTRQELGWNTVVTCAYSAYCPKLLIGDPRWQVARSRKAINAHGRREAWKPPPPASGKSGGRSSCWPRS